MLMLVFIYYNTLQTNTDFGSMLPPNNNLSPLKLLVLPLSDDKQILREREGAAEVVLCNEMELCLSTKQSAALFARDLGKKGIIEIDDAGSMYSHENIDRKKGP
jgi:hypothetical protein